MQPGVIEVLLALSGASVIAAGLLAPGASPRQRVKLVLCGALMIGYAIWIAEQHSGIVFVSTSGLGLGLVVPIVLYRDWRAQRQRRRTFPELPSGTPGARRCLNCQRSYPAETIGACPGCRGTLAPPTPPITKEQ